MKLGKPPLRRLQPERRRITPSANQELLLLVKQRTVVRCHARTLRDRSQCSRNRRAPRNAALDVPQPPHAWYYELNSQRGCSDRSPPFCCVVSLALAL